LQLPHVQQRQSVHRHGAHLQQAQAFFCSVDAGVVVWDVFMVVSLGHGGVAVDAGSAFPPWEGQPPVRKILSSRIH